MEILAVIPARGGSKGVPGKNIKLLAGKPLIAWTIEEAKKSKHITRIIVSTDDEKIASVAREYGAEIPFLRPQDIAQDLSTDVEFLQHAIDALRQKDGYEPELVLRLPPTSPLRNSIDIDKGIEALLSDPEADASRPITEAPKHPYKMWKTGERYLEPFLSKAFTGFDEPHNLPRQLFPKVYVHTGAMDVMRRATIEEQKSTSGRRLAYFFMEPERSVNIDHLIDFEIADYLMKKRLRA
ncbi:MAG: acylneuraminate cytidylyltransferase family protein [Candidatus Pacebacteria bacterium]|nr:acylneuraminate cytidylyltransferase family protein [Candidatus Paceibacterota bacterium]